MLWANNGDIISRQYAGTVALKVSHKQAREPQLSHLLCRETSLAQDHGVWPA